MVIEVIPSGNYSYILETIAMKILSGDDGQYFWVSGVAG